MAGPPPTLVQSPAAGPASTSTTTTAPSPSTALSIPEALWSQQIPLIIRHTSAPPDSAPFVTLVPRFSYLALLLPRLGAYFAAGGGGLSCSSFHHEDVLLRNLAVGLLADLYQPVLPWRLTVSDGVGWDIGDTFLNSAKEVCLPCPSGRKGYSPALRLLVTVD